MPKIKKPKTHKSYVWVNLPAKPLEYDLVLLAFENGKAQPMWWTGKKWDGFKALPDSKPVAWRKMGPQ